MEKSIKNLICTLFQIVLYSITILPYAVLYSTFIAFLATVAIAFIIIPLGASPSIGPWIFSFIWLCSATKFFIKSISDK